MLVQSTQTAYRQYTQRVKSSGGMPMAFKEFLTLEKEKVYSATGEDTVVLLDKNLNDSVQAAIQETLKPNLKTTESGKTVFGINKWVFFGSIALLVGTGMYLIVRKRS